MKFDGKTVVVTGGTGALGAAVVEKLVAEGGEGFVPVHKRKDGKVREGRGGGGCGKVFGAVEKGKDGKRPEGRGGVEDGEGVDLTDEGGVEGFYGKVGSAGGLWASIHTAGGFAMAPLADVKKADFVGMMQMNA